MTDNPQTPETTYPETPDVNRGELPDPMTDPVSGKRVTSPGEWPALAQTWRQMILDMEYGGLPPEPDSVETETLCHNFIRTLPGKPGNWTYRIHCRGGQRDFSFCVRILFPQTEQPVPAIIDGDGCWWRVYSDDLVQRVTGAGYALVIFNRTELAEDLGYSGCPDKHQRRGGLYDVYPQASFGALSAWAWGYHRCVDLLRQLPFIDASRIAVTGHSRGGKTALLAGATDDRIALVNDNASCAGGAPVFRYVGHGGETLKIINKFPTWFGAGMQPYVERENELPFDQHCLLATVAPRPLLMTYALDDRWSNPEGMVLSVRAASEVYRLLEVPDHLAFHLRPGAHAHTLDDWNVLLDFMAWKWQGTPPTVKYNQHPYKHLET